MVDFRQVFVQLGVCYQQRYLFILGEVLTKGRGQEQQIPGKALLEYWLSNFVFPSFLEDGLHNYVFPLMVMLAKGKEAGPGVTLCKLFIRQA